MTLQLFGRHTSYNVQKVLWLLDELGLEYQHIQLGGKYGGTDSPEFGKMNPMRKVPVLKDDDRVIWESNTILRYLVDAYGESEWKVKDSYQRSEYERWMDWAQSRFERAFDGVFWGYYRTPPELRDEKAIQKSEAACKECLEKLDGQLQGKSYVVSENLSLADICNGVFIYRLVEIDLDIRLPGQVEAWYGRLKSLSGYQKWVMSDFTELKGRLAY